MIQTPLIYLDAGFGESSVSISIQLCVSAQSVTAPHLDKILTWLLLRKLQRYEVDVWLNS